MLRVAEQAFAHRHRAPAQRQRGLLLRPRPDLRRRRRDGWRPGRARSPRSGRRGLRGASCPTAPRRASLTEVIEAANREIHEMARRDPSVAGMGTTITAAIVDAERDEVVDRPRRRQPRLPPPRRQARAAHPRPLAGRGDAAQGPAHRRAGRGAPAALDHHPRARPRAARSRSTSSTRAGDARRRLPALLGRADDDGRRGADRADLITGATSLDAAVRSAGRRGQPRPAAATTSPRSLFRLEDAAAPVGGARGDGPTLVGPAAEEEGFTADEVRRRAGAPPAAAARGAPRRAARRAARRKVLAALLLVAARRLRRLVRRTARSGSSAPTTAAASRSTAACPTSCRWASTSTTSATRARSRPTSLPSRRQEAVTGHDLRSRDDAVSLIEDIERTAGAPRGPTASPSRPRTPQPSRPPEPPGRAPARRAAGTAAERRAATPPAPPAPGRSERTQGERPQPRAARADPGRAAAHRRFTAVFAQESTELGNLSLIYGGYFLAICLATHIFLRIRPARRRPLPLPARRPADRVRPGDDLPDRRDPRPRPGQLVRPRARPLRADDPLPARLRRARALPLHDRAGRNRAAARAADARGSASRSTAPTSASSSARSSSSRPSSRRSASSSSSRATCASTARC